MILTQQVQCPHCGERFVSTLDISGGSSEYTEDCYICCRPIVFLTRVDYDGELLSVEIRKEND